jgi:hypothetical protein
MTVLERAAQEIADAAAHPLFLFQFPLKEGRDRETGRPAPATVLTAEADMVRTRTRRMRASCARPGFRSPPCATWAPFTTSCC